MGKNYASEDAGYFRVQQSKSGGWAFVDPFGEPFVSLALNHLDDSDLRYPHNVDMFDRKYGTRRNWAKGVVRDLEDLNFNTIVWTGSGIPSTWATRRPGPMSSCSTPACPTWCRSGCRKSRTGTVTQHFVTYTAKISKSMQTGSHGA